MEEKKANMLGVNLLTVLASSIYCQLKSSNRDRDILDAVVSIVVKENSDGLYSRGIKGHISFGTMGDVQFGLKYGDHGGFDLRITQDIIKSEDVICLTPNEHSTPIWIDFPSHKAYYMWDEYLETDLEPAMVDKPKEINAFAKKIVSIILSKVKSSTKVWF